MKATFVNAEPNADVFDGLFRTDTHRDLVQKRRKRDNRERLKRFVIHDILIAALASCITSLVFIFLI